MWRSADRPLDSFRQSFPLGVDAELRDAAIAAGRTGAPVESLTTADLPLGALADFVRELKTELFAKSGFVILAGFPVDDLSQSEIECYFWGIGLGLGTAVSQSVMGERLGHVRDVTEHDPHARAYRNRSELTPHSDPADLLAFLCLRPAARGGISRFVSSTAIHQEIATTRPDLLERLYRGYRYHRLGENLPGTPNVTPHRLPVFSECAGLVSCRYVRQYIEVAADEFDDIELDALDIEALDLLETIAADPDFHHEFTLDSGEAVFANNFTVMHARSSFEDHPEIDRRRHLLRLWLSTDPKRPILPEVLHYAGEPGIAPIPGRRPSYETSVEVQ